MRSGRPWWTYAVPYFGRVPDLAPAQWRTLGLLGAAELFDHYDLGILGLALLQIQQGLGIGEGEIAGVTAVVRLGVIPALLLTVMADRIGRRRLLLATILGFSLTTFATAFARTPTEFMALQFLARVFVYGETMLAVVVLAEELAARERGFGIGMLGALGALGHGLSALVFAFVDVLPHGWRALYALGALPLLLLAWFRRGLPETRRFEEHRRTRVDRGGLRDAAGPMLALLRAYPGRLAVLSLAIVPWEFVTMTAMQFLAKTLQEMHGYSPGAVTALYLTGGALGILGNLVAGTLSDRLGRKRVMGLAIALNGAAIYGFYNAPSAWVPPFWIALVFSLMGVQILFKALGSELFPTSYRSTASGVRAIAGTLGGVAGLALEGRLYALLGSHAAAITATLPVLLLPLLVIRFALPETAARELEEIAPER
jgi:putative MFS transporter